MHDHEDHQDHHLDFSLDDKPNAGDVNATIVSLSEAAAETINAEQVSISQGSAGKISAVDVKVSQGGIREVEAETVTLEQGGANTVQAVNFSLDNGGVGIVQAETAVVSNAGVGIAYGQTIELQEGAAANIVFARRVNATNTQIKVLLAGSVEGEVTTLLDTRQAAAAGLGIGFVVGLLLLIAEWFGRRK